MTEDRITFILDIIKKHPSHCYGEAINSSADVWGGYTAWGYSVVYNPQTNTYKWDDTQDIGGGFNSVESMQLSEKELVEKLGKILK